jgi:FkbM family methyltransferase
MKNKILIFIYKIIFFFKGIKYKKINNLIFLGSKYGGKYFHNIGVLKNKYVISAGLGEDASFDIELINKTGCKVILIDPTPRSIEHYKKIIMSVGKKNELNYNLNGNQPVKAYNLVKINSNNLKLVKRALYNRNLKKINFYSPLIINHVSHSLITSKNKYFETTRKIQVATVTLKKILQTFKIKNVELIKLDIEGAEIDVIENIIKNAIFPNQILVEFDDLMGFKINNLNRFIRTHNLLTDNGYNLIKTKDNFPNMLYLRNQ